MAIGKWMPTRQPLPKIWLMTDPRLGDGLVTAVQRLPSGSGVIFRHYELDEISRRRLFRRVMRVCRRRGHMLLLAASEREAIRWHADGFHQRSGRRSRMPHSMAAHDYREIAAANRWKAEMVLISPLFVTQTHSGQRPLGRLAFNRLAAAVQSAKVIALGGVTKRVAASLNPDIVDGWAGIDAFRN
jgi:thiamine-phosphate pyrophosphorylase